MLQVNQTYIIAGSGESWYRSSLSFTNSFPYEHECLPKTDQRAFYQIYWITLKSAWRVTWCDFKIVNQIKQWTETRAIEELTIIFNVTFFLPENVTSNSVKHFSLLSIWLLFFFLQKKTVVSADFAGCGCSASADSRFSNTQNRIVLF